MAAAVMGPDRKELLIPNRELGQHGNCRGRISPRQDDSLCGAADRCRMRGRTEKRLVQNRPTQ